MQFTLGRKHVLYDMLLHFARGVNEVKIIIKMQPVHEKGTRTE
jgi:hypothetical protein